MYISPDDAKTDVILAAVAAVLGISLRGYLAGLPLYPRSGVLGQLLELVWIVALTALVPVLLARYRREGATAFGFAAAGPGAPRGRNVGWGLALAAPAALLGIVIVVLVASAGVVNPLLGRIGIALTTGSATEAGFTAVRVVLYAVGSLLLVGFLAVRSRDGFPRSPDMAVTQLVRTIGLVIVGVSFVGGLLRVLGGGSWSVAVANTLGVAAIVLLTDRRVPPGLVVPRTAVLAPVLVVVFANVHITGGFFRGDLVAGLTAGALATGVTLAVAALAHTRDGVGIALPLVFAAHLWPTCLSPLALVRVVEPLGGFC